MAVGLQSLLRTVVDNKASGLHIRGNSNAYVRLNGQIKPIDDSFVSNEEARKMAQACMGERERKIFEKNHTVDFSLDAKSYGRFRFNVFQHSGKIAMAIRHIPLKIPTFKDLSLPEEVLKKISDNPGLDNVHRSDVAQLYIIHPDEEFDNDMKLTGWVAKANIMFCTHPDTPERIKLLEQF